MNSRSTSTIAHTFLLLFLLSSSAAAVALAAPEESHPQQHPTGRRRQRGKTTPPSRDERRRTATTFVDGDSSSTTTTTGGRRGETARRSQSEWPHYLTLELTFDEHPEQVSWKFENRRTSNVLAGVAFGSYDESQANGTIVEMLDILTNDDYEDDSIGSQPGIMREYRFVIYDRGGNGLCCDHGNGKYELFSRVKLIATGDSYGAIDENFFTIDPREYLGEDEDGSLPVINMPAVNIPPSPTPVVPIPQTPAEIISPSSAVDADTPRPTGRPTARGQTMPALILSFFCGATFEDAEENCRLPCPTGSPSQCAGDDPERGTCYASTTCRERGRYPTPDPTGAPSEGPSIAPTRRPTPQPTPRPTRPRPTSPPTPSPQVELATDSTTWFCGFDWDWITDNCDLAIPCPRGDAVECPANQACFASTPCTLSPTINPTLAPSEMPSKEPTPNPTKSPWSEASFVDFLYGQSYDGQGDDGGNSGNGKGSNQAMEPMEQRPSPGGTSAGIDEALASKVNEALANYSSLQYHFFCGISWTHAHESCNVFCPSGDKSDCPGELECYANTPCDGRDTPSPTTSPAPSVWGAAGNAPASSEGEVCTLCDQTTLNPSISVSMNTQTTTCGDLEQMIRSENILAGSVTCNNARDMYRGSCCYEECQLCQNPDGTFLDLRSEYVVKQGGYEARCQDISNVLSTATKDDSICTDAQSQLGGVCCYEQCTLCGDRSDMSTQWSAMVIFQDLQTTCLGLDYMLRFEQTSYGSDQCSEIRGAYMDWCCYATNSCQLCEADDKLYELDTSKTVTVEHSSFMTTVTTCTAMNDLLFKSENTDQECIDGKQAFFGQCCDLSNAIVSDNGISPAGSPNNAYQPSPVTGASNPSPGGVPNPVPFPTSPGPEVPALYQPSPGTGASDPSPGGMRNPGAEEQPPPGSSIPTSSTQTTTNKPTLPHYWGLQPATGDFTWEQNWAPPNGGYRAAVIFSLVIFGMSTLLLVFA